MDAFVWKLPLNFPEHLIAEYDSARSPDRFLFLQGTALADPSPIYLRFPAPSLHLQRYATIASSAMVPVVNAALASALLDLVPDRVQFVPTVIECSNGVSVDTFATLNATRLCEGTDLRRSDFVTFTGTNAVRRFSRLVLRPGCLADLDLARDLHYWPHLLVSVRLAQELAHRGFRHLDLVPSASIGD